MVLVPVSVRVADRSRRLGSLSVLIYSGVLSIDALYLRENGYIRFAYSDDDTVAMVVVNLVTRPGMRSSR